jgi:serine/threonine protein kinase
MDDPRRHVPATPPPLPSDATGEWSEGTAQGSPPPAGPTVTSSGTPPALEPEAFDIPNPFGRYMVIRLLGRGGMGAVFLAHDTQLDRPVALKIPAFGDTLTTSQKNRFAREARANAAVHHPNICPLWDVGEEQDIVYFTMAYIEGQPLSTLTERGPVPPDKAVALVRKVALAMQAAHVRGTIHRDLKPANIMIDQAGEPVVMDFGLAKQARSADFGPRSNLSESDAPSKVPSTLRTTASDLTQHGSVLGTPAYMPPEQARGDVAAMGPHSDVYSLGVILYELLTGRRPFVATDTAELIHKIANDPPPRPTDFYPWIDAGVESACLKALAKNPGDRFGTMAEFERALKDAIEPELTYVAPPPLPPRGSGARPAVAAPKKRRHPLMKLAGCLGIVTLFLVLCVGAPTLAVRWLIGEASDKLKELTQAQERSNAEWDAIMGFWHAPAADAPVDSLLPPTFAGNYRRLRHDQDAADPELGINLPGRRGVYSTPEGQEVEVRVYRCPDAEAKAIQARVQAFVQSVKDGTAPDRPDSKRQKVIYTASNPGIRTFTYTFTDTYSQNAEYGKVWYGHDWLFLFKTSSPLIVEFFPSKYLMEVSKRAATPPKEVNEEMSKTMKKK